MNDVHASIWCPNCRESNSPARARCWLCDASLEGLEPDVRRAATEASSESFDGHQLLNASFPLTIAVLFVILGTMILVPGLGILLACVLCVPLVRTALLMKRRADRGHVDAFPATVGLFIGSLGVTFVILTLVGITAFGAFCAVCFGAYSSTENIEIAVLVSGVVTLAVLIPVCRKLWKWAKRRWKRDIGERPEPE